MFGDDRLFENLVQAGEEIEADSDKNVDEAQEPLTKQDIQFAIGELQDKLAGDEHASPDDLDRWAAELERLEAELADAPDEAEFESEPEEDRRASAERWADDVHPELSPSSKERYVADVEPEGPEIPVGTPKEIPVGFDLRGDEIHPGDTVSIENYSEGASGQGTLKAIWDDGTVDVEHTSGPGGPMTDTFDIKGHGIWKIDPWESKTNEEEVKEEEKVDEGAQEDYDAAIGSLVALVSEWVGEDVPQEQIEIVLHNLVLSGAGLEDAVRAHGNLRAEKDLGTRDRFAVDDVEEAKVDVSCPQCKSSDTWNVEGDVFECNECGLRWDEDTGEVMGEKRTDTVSNDPSFERTVEEFAREGAMLDTNEDIREDTRRGLANDVASVLSGSGALVDLDELGDYLVQLNTDDYNALEQAVKLGNKDEIIQIMKSVGFTESKTNEDDATEACADKKGVRTTGTAYASDADKKKEEKVDESYGSVYIEADLHRGMSREAVIKKLQTRYPDIGDEEAEKIVTAVEKGEDWPRRESVEKVEEQEEVVEEPTPEQDAPDVDFGPLEVELEKMLGIPVPLTGSLNRGRYGNPRVGFSSENLIEHAGIFKAALKEVFVQSFSGGEVNEEGSIWWTVVLSFEVKRGGHNGVDIMRGAWYDTNSGEWTFEAA